MKAYLDFIIPEGEKIDGGRFDLTPEIWRHLYDNSKIDRKFNEYLRGKKVIIVGPASYMLEKESADFIESFDVVVRLNRGWNVKEELKKNLGARTDVRYHCGMEHENNGGAWNIQGMLDYGVQWAAIQFPRNLDYFHNDVLNFEKLNSEYQMNRHVWSDLELYMTIHHYLGTRISIGTAAFTDLIFYDVERLHVSGITFLQDGWYKGYKQREYFNDKEYMKEDLWKDKLDVGGHAMTPQIKLLNLIRECDDRLTVDKEMEQYLKV
jgi:hypothetical protein